MSTLRNKLEEKIEEALDNYDWDEIIDDAIRNVDLDDVIEHALENKFYRDNPFEYIIERKARDIVDDILDEIDFENYIEI